MAHVASECAPRMSYSMARLNAYVRSSMTEEENLDEYGDIIWDYIEADVYLDLIDKGLVTEQQCEAALRSAYKNAIDDRGNEA